MTEPSATALPGTAPAPPARLEPDAIGVAQDTVIGMATSAPAAVVAITLASLAATANYGGGPVLLISAIPMLIIANAYRRLNMWNANSGASFEWVGRSINPYLGFLTGWLMIAGYVLGTLSGVEVLGPSVLAVFGSSADSKWANVAIATAVGLVMLVIAVAGIRITARTQVGMAVVEYTILVGISIWGLVYVLGHHAGTVPVTSGWFSPTGIGGQGDFVVGARIIYGMASYRTLPEFLSNVSSRFRTPAAASVLFGVVVIALAWVYLLATSVQNAFTYVVDLTGLLFAIFYVLTAIASMVYYRRRVVSSAWDAFTLGLLPLASAVFLVWMVVKSLMGAQGPERWSMVGIVVAGLLLMLIARFGLKSWFFQIQRESDPGPVPASTR